MLFKADKNRHRLKPCIIYLYNCCSKLLSAGCSNSVLPQCCSRQMQTDPTIPGRHTSLIIRPIWQLVWHLPIVFCLIVFVFVVLVIVISSILRGFASLIIQLVRHDLSSPLLSPSISHLPIIVFCLMLHNAVQGNIAIPPKVQQLCLD